MSRSPGLQPPAAARVLPLAFARRLIDWQLKAGRRGMPWQGTRDPYRVWLSEVMLQQTQVSSVSSYYPRFLARFPDVHSLAAASSDDVMALWSGLGYYSRARNLHRCAQVVVAEHQGIFPTSAQALQALPGIGASTAAAIAAFCHGERVSILDGNVRRVLSRLLAFEGDLSQLTSQRELLALAQALLPVAPSLQDMSAYTQGLMDLGATLCTRSRPNCEGCPVAGLCQARAQAQVSRFPIKTRTLKRRHESWWLLLVRDRSAPAMPRVWLEQRPPRGIWAGLYCLPVFDSEAALLAAAPASMRPKLEPLTAVAHSLTHRELRLHPMALDIETSARVASADRWLPAGRWVALDALEQVGLPAPVRQLLRG
ncbi:A/G-specific adenine glycosylase [Hydrogenophaga sp.]|uniref:A/G-specific adenine glycosylase n=1 Tax=Hydrogenophaga sp. TaxID=1904254 RepID=UPI0035613AF2